MKRLIRYCILTILLILLSISMDNNSNTYAADTYTIVPGSNATLIYGLDLNKKIKSLVKSSATSTTEDKTITSIEWTNEMPQSGVTTVNVSNSGSDVIAYLDGTVIKLYTTAETIYLNKSCYGMFKSFTVLKTIPMLNSRINPSKITDIKQMFDGCYKLTELNLSNWDVSNVTAIYSVFDDCESLTTLNLSNWRVTNKCNSLMGMFGGCKNLTTLTCDFTTWDVSNVNCLQMVFYRCEKLTTLNLTGWKVTNKCDNLLSMFKGCKNLKTLTCDFTTWDVSNVTTFYSMFEDCSKLTTLDLSNWNVSNGTNFEYMFDGCYKLTTLNLTRWQVTNKCTELNRMFMDCYKLKSINVSNWNVSNVTDFWGMFSGCEALTILDLSGWQITNKCKDFTYMFYNCTNLKTIKINSSWDISNISISEKIFSKCSKLESLDLSTWIINNKNLQSLFTGCPNLTELKLPNTASVISLNNTFNGCSKLTEIDLSNWTIDIRTNNGLENTFLNCSNAIIKLPNTINFNKCESFCNTFKYCKKLTEMPACFKQPNLDLTKIKYFSSMFQNTGLTSVDLSNWITSNNAKRYYRMFCDCTNLTQITGLNNLNMEGVIDDSVSDYLGINYEHNKNEVPSYITVGSLDKMFYNTQITELDISSWNFLGTNIDIITRGGYGTPIFPNTLEKIKMFNINDNNIYLYGNMNWFSNNMFIDNDENGISDIWDCSKNPRRSIQENDIYKKMDLYIRFEFDGGKYIYDENEDEDIDYYTIYVNKKYITEIPDNVIPIPIKENATFLGYYTQSKDGELVDTKIIPSGNVTYYAHWESTVFTIYLHSNDILNSESEYVNDSKVIELKINVNDNSDLVSKLLPAIQELKNDGYLHNDGYLVTDMLYSGTLPSNSINLNEMSIRNDTTNQLNTRNNKPHSQSIFYGFIQAWLTSENALGSDTSNLFTTIDDEYHFYVINPIYNIRVNNINIDDKIKLNDSWFTGNKIYYGDNLIYYNPYVEMPIFNKQYEYDLLNGNGT